MENQITGGYGHAPPQTNILIITLSNAVISFIKLLGFWIKTHDETNDEQGTESDGNRNKFVDNQIYYILFKNWRYILWQETIDTDPNIDWSGVFVSRFKENTEQGKKQFHFGNKKPSKLHYAKN